MEEKISGDHGEVEVEQIERIRVVHDTHLIKSPWPDSSYEEQNEPNSVKQYAEERVLPPPPRANRLLWCIALLIASAIILAALAVLIVYLSFHPKLPRLELTNVVLKRIDLDRSTYIFKTEMIAFLKFNNPNDRVDLRYEDINFKLYFRDDIIATQVLDSFGQKRGNITDRFVIRMVSSRNTELTPLSALIMEQQIVKKSTILYKFFGKMTTVARLGRIKRIHYRLYLDCQLRFSVPPKAVLRHQECKTSHSL